MCACALVAAKKGSVKTQIEKDTKHRERNSEGECRSNALHTDVCSPLRTPAHTHTARCFVEHIQKLVVFYTRICYYIIYTSTASADTFCCCCILAVAHISRLHPRRASFCLPVCSMSLASSSHKIIFALWSVCCSSSN